MAKDKRYSSVKVLIENKHITSFRNIFDHIPMSVVYNDMGFNYARFRKLLNRPALFTLQELIDMAKLFGMDNKAFIDMAYEQQQIDSRGKRRGGK